MGKARYRIVSCPSDDTEKLENLLNEMSKAGWDLYTMHEVETDDGYNYNCIFVTTAEEEELEDNSADNLEVFKNRMEKILIHDNTPAQICADVLKKIEDKRKKISDITTKLEEAKGAEHEKLNNEISNLMNELNNLKKQYSKVSSPEAVENYIGEDRISVHLSEELIELAHPDKSAKLLLENIKIRQKLVQKTGFILPSCRFLDSEDLQANEFSINVRGVSAFRSYVYPGYLMFYIDELAIDRLPKNSIKDNDQISGREIVWIEEKHTKDFWTNGIRPEEYIGQAMEFVCIKNIDEIFDYGDLNRYVDLVMEENPFLVENCIPDFISLSELKYLLVNLVKEQVSIKDIIYIFEKINDFSDESIKDDLLDKIRVSLSKQISASLSDDSNLISVISLSQETIDSILNLMDNNEQTIVRVDGGKLKVIIDKLVDVANEFQIPRDKIVLLAPLEVRHMIAMVLLQLIPNLRVVAEEEISTDYAVDIIATL